MTPASVITRRIIPGGIFLMLLLSADIAFVLVHLVHEFSPYLKRSLFSIEQDRGYAEIFQYVKIFWIVVMLAVIWRRTREPVYCMWMLLYVFLLFDDAFFFHETYGTVIAAYWQYAGSLGLRAQDFGELTVSAAAGVVFAGLILAGYFRGAREARSATADLVILLGLIAFFGVVIDMLHVLAPPGNGKLVLGMVEDGGEMLAMSLVCSYVYSRLERRDRHGRES